MTDGKLNQTTERRGFLGAIASVAAALGLSAIASPLNLVAQQQKPSTKKALPPASHPADLWFNKIKGTHRVVYDAPHPNGLFPFAWPKVFLLTNAATGSPPNDCGVVVVLRHDAIAYAFEDRLWSTYKFGEIFKAEDPKTKTPSTRNPFWMPMKGDFKIPGVGEVEIGINQLQAQGVLFCVCDTAITVYSAVVAEQMGKVAADVRKDWIAGLLPGIQLVPSGVWALGRAQEHKCKYIFAG